ncbi:Crp/Fnr family transcriptional regulator [Aquimarina litoralis]|uniref:Crp/Fnr family transcriptional regulator n=1 Tax=Aquimarina litoralis TaxID=584605 RepID=UPI001C590006|nr:Crp/Fnr family transcriptional regulator [Aquimarina litoralis]MBW1294118.1 cyclic nucleotide-binding domain-containing protein [Aquimarina litoralis]
MNDAINLLKTTLDNFHKLTDEEFHDFSKISEFTSFQKKEFLLESGHYNHGILFITKGILGLYETIETKEIYTSFFQVSDFATEITSLASQKTSLKNIIAITNVEGFYIKRNDLLQLYDKSISFERLGRKLLEHLLSEQHRFTTMLTSLKPKDRYKYLLENNPKLIQQIPVQYLASYIGIARETLSRIRKRMS